MELYIEFVILDNMVMNFLLLFLTAKVFRLSTSRLKIFLSAMLGTIIAIFLSLLSVMTWLLIILKLLIPVSMLLIISSHYNAKKFFLCYITFLSLTFLIGGSCLAVLFLLNAEVFDIILLEYEYILPVGIFILLIVSYTKIIEYGIKYFYRKKTISNYLYDIRVHTKNKVISFVAFLDSGNMLCDKKTNLPVLIVSSSLLRDIYDEIEPKEKHYLEYSTISGTKNNMLVFKPKLVEVFIKDDNKKMNIGEMMIGVVDKKFKDYDGLLPSALFV